MITLDETNRDISVRYIRPADVVKQTNLSKTTVMEAIWSGDLEAYRVGRSWLIPAEAVDRWVRGDAARVA